MNKPWLDSGRGGFQVTSAPDNRSPFDAEQQVLGTIRQQADECQQLLRELADEWRLDAHATNLKAGETIRRTEFRIRGMFAHLNALAWGGAPRRQHDNAPRIAEEGL